MKRAITLGGGGPAAGLHLGALKCFRDHGITFDVWALSCIGVWVGAHYVCYPPETAPEDTIEHFRKYVFRDDVSYDKFPISPGFVPDIQHNSTALMKYLVDPTSYQNLFAPVAIRQAGEALQTYMSDPKYWNPNAFAQLTTAMAAANPMTRFMTSWLWKSEMTGLTGGHHKGPGLSTNLNVEELFEPDKPFLYHNAWNMTDDRIEMFANRVKPPRHMQKMTSESMSACSALPFLIEPVEFNGKSYCEGALVRTVSFTDLIQDHPDLEEIWVIRIVDPKQIRPPKNMDDAMNNLCMLFAGALGESNVEEFEEHLAQHPKLAERIKVRVVPVSHEITYDWNHSNLELGVEQGYKFTQAVIEEYLAEGRDA
ncbi:patatin-like phospholipase family protein [Algicella marina]|uniref:Patatin-like phospholipase family protein n=1 Tax=Algicella marina TaxID=2683284 RepID=A0A6P1T099_9RHOB|nr:patatin-like phospholipase family protein [Algicella marina]QHQ36344.1 patatin-like phospholipase family protein [Algicella marina]